MSKNFLCRFLIMIYSQTLLLRSILRSSHHRVRVTIDDIPSIALSGTPKLVLSDPTRLIMHYLCNLWHRLATLNDQAQEDYSRQTRNRGRPLSYRYCEGCYVASIETC